MRQNVVPEVPVLIVGAGPAGLTAAITLARYGVDSLVVERRADLSSLPRATAVSTRTMEIMRTFGLEERVRSGGIDVEWNAWITETLASPVGVPMPLGFPTREEAALISPTTPACVPQDHLEPVLLDHLRSFPGVDIRFSTELVTLEQDSEWATATLLDTASERTIAVRARYVLAADGAHSRVRAVLGIPMEGPDNLIEHSTVLFEAPLWEVLGDRRHGIYVITHPEAAGIFVPVGADDRWLYGRELAQAHQRPENTDSLADLLRTASGIPWLRPRIERLGSFSFAAQIASRYREQRVFLIGDAAHRVTPRGGTGMNTAIHDGFDLAWKLGWVLSGWAEPELLDTYETERRPVGLLNTARSADPNGSQREAAEGLVADLGDRIPHAWLSHDGARTSTLDLLGPGLTLLTDEHGGIWRHALPSTVATIVTHIVDEPAAEALGMRGGGAVLVRPDAKPIATWLEAVQDPVSAMAAAVTGMAVRTNGPVPAWQRVLAS
ncbi:MAG TPA: FAD-dependent monooxygenase [Jiangellaceae bacterium]|nr:FAD-dependent monooxygenase [Jiangellaceae bacterium]